MCLQSLNNHLLYNNRNNTYSCSRHKTERSDGDIHTPMSMTMTTAIQTLSVGPSPPHLPTVNCQVSIIRSVLSNDNTNNAKNRFLTTTQPYTCTIYGLVNTQIQASVLIIGLHHNYCTMETLADSIRSK